jgi:hypothetical protein
MRPRTADVKEVPAAFGTWVKTIGAAISSPNSPKRLARNSASGQRRRGGQAARERASSALISLLQGTGQRVFQLGDPLAAPVGQLDRALVVAAQGVELEPGLLQRRDSRIPLGDRLIEAGDLVATLAERRLGLGNAALEPRQDRKQARDRLGWGRHAAAHTIDATTLHCTLCEN